MLPRNFVLLSIFLFSTTYQIFLYRSIRRNTTFFFYFYFYTFYFQPRVSHGIVGINDRWRSYVFSFNSVFYYSKRVTLLYLISLLYCTCSCRDYTFIFSLIHWLVNEKNIVKNIPIIRKIMPPLFFFFLNPNFNCLRRVRVFDTMLHFICEKITIHPPWWCNKPMGTLGGTFTGGSATPEELQMQHVVKSISFSPLKTLSNCLTPLRK